MFEEEDDEEEEEAKMHHLKCQQFYFYEHIL